MLKGPISSYPSTGYPVVLKATARMVDGKYKIVPNMPVFVENAHASDEKEKCPLAFTQHDALLAAAEVTCIGVSVTAVDDCTAKEAIANKGRIMFTYIALGPVVLAHPMLHSPEHYVGNTYYLNYGKPTADEQWAPPHNNHARASTFIKDTGTATSKHARFVLMDVSNCDMYNACGGLFFFYGAGACLN